MKINKSEERLKVSSDSESSPSTSIQMLRPRSNSGRLLTDQVNTSSSIGGVMVTVLVSFGRLQNQTKTIKVVFVVSPQSVITKK